tara:strand:- start:1100 stop:1789 length:690 start_codon:yes stop_codon:yes gene_type:complete
MKTNHQLARLKAHSLGNIAVFGNSYENGIFSKINTFGGAKKAIRARRAYNTRGTALVARGDSLRDNFVVPGRGRPVSVPAARQSAARSFVDAARADLFDADNPLIGGEADSTLVGKPLLTYQEWDAGNPAPRSQSELVGRQNAYDAYKSAWQSSNSTGSNLGSGPASAAYFGSDPAMVRKEGGIMTSVTTFGNADSEEHSHKVEYLAGSGATMLALLAGYFALKFTRRI